VQLSNDKKQTKRKTTEDILKFSADVRDKSGLHKRAVCL